MSDYEENDSRTPCKYGAKCYQKNPQHHKKFKHPLKSTEKGKEDSFNEDSNLSPPAKRVKLDESEKCSPTNGDNSKNQSNEDIELSNPEENSTEANSDEEGDVSDEDDVPLPKPSLDIKERMKQMFLVAMPADFYDFWDFCKSENKDRPEDALSSIGLKLVGPFDVLSGKLDGIKDLKLYQCLCHWRFYYDPPEFQTVLVGKENGFRIGYFRDDPAEDPVFLASLSDQKPIKIHPMKEDLFSTLHSFINSVSCKASSSVKSSLSEKLVSFAGEKNYKFTETSDRLKARKKKVVAKSFHGAGIVVPIDKENDVGYREIPETDADLRRILKKIDEAPSKEARNKAFEALHEILTNAQWATDEGDFGMGLELGIDLFIFGSKEFHTCIKHLLTVAYQLLNREPFSKIIKAHLRNRRTGSQLSSFATQ